MVKILNSLQTKLTISFILLIVIISGMTFLYTYGETKKALKDIMRDELKAVAGVAATQIDGDILQNLKAGDENTTDFSYVLKQMQAMKASNPDIYFIYTYTIKDGKISFLVDAEYGVSEEDASAIGDEYDETPERMVEGFSMASADDDFTADKWGTFISGYAPIMNSNGEIVAAVGVDMSSNRVIQKQNFIGNTIYAVIGIGIIIAAIIIALFSLTIIRDINKMNVTANKISMGEMDVTVDVRRKDEIGELADSFGRMVASLKIMMMKDDTPAKAEQAPETNMKKMRKKR